MKVGTQVLRHTVRALDYKAALAVVRLTEAIDGKNNLKTFTCRTHCTKPGRDQEEARKGELGWHRSLS